MSNNKISELRHFTEINNILTRVKTRNYDHNKIDLINFLNDKDIYNKDLVNHPDINLVSLMDEEYVKFLNHIMSIHVQKPFTHDDYDDIEDIGWNGDWPRFDMGDMMYYIRIFLAWRKIQKLFSDSPVVNLSLEDVAKVMSENYNLYPSY